MNEHLPTPADFDEDMLVSRVASSEASGEEWRRFEVIATAQPVAWERLARTLRDELAIRCALDATTAPAEAVSLPAMSRGERRLQLVQSWPGWALAAVLALAWAVSFFTPGFRAGNEASIGTPIMPARNSADEAYHDYLTLGAQEGRVLQELPMMMIETRFNENQGRVEVVYVRQLLERTTVESAIEIAEDALGRPITVPVDLDAIKSARPL